MSEDPYPPIARVWRGRTRRDVVDTDEANNYEAGILPLIDEAPGVQTCREDRDEESEFVTISSSADLESMAAFAGDEPTAIHRLDRDQEFLIELPRVIQILRLRHSHGRVAPG